LRFQKVIVNSEQQARPARALRPPFWPLYPYTAR
jgi:hypothetical protein